MIVVIPWGACRSPGSRHGITLMLTTWTQVQNSILPLSMDTPCLQIRVALACGPTALFARMLLAILRGLLLTLSVLQSIHAGTPWRLCLPTPHLCRHTEHASAHPGDLPGAAISTTAHRRYGRNGGVDRVDGGRWAGRRNHRARAYGSWWSSGHSHDGGRQCTSMLGSQRFSSLLLVIALMTFLGKGGQVRNPPM